MMTNARPIYCEFTVMILGEMDNAVYHGKSLFLTIARIILTQVGHLHKFQMLTNQLTALLAE